MHLSPSIGHDLVTGTRFMGAFTMFALSILLAFVNRGKTQLKVYNQARWLIFTGCLLLCIFNLVQFLGFARHERPARGGCVCAMGWTHFIHPTLHHHQTHFAYDAVVAGVRILPLRLQHGGNN